MGFVGFVGCLGCVGCRVCGVCGVFGLCGVYCPAKKVSESVVSNPEVYRIVPGTSTVRLRYTIPSDYNNDTVRTTGKGTPYTKKSLFRFSIQH